MRNELFSTGIFELLALSLLIFTMFRSLPFHRRRLCDET